MCSVDPDEIVEMTRATKGLDLSGGDVNCRKCGERAAEVVLRVKDAYCRDCFLAYFVHKFRSTIGKSKQIRHGDGVFCATSGGASSAAMLHLIRQGLNETSHKQLRFLPAFLYIDESCISDTPEAGPEYVHEVCSEVLKADFKCYVTSLQQIMATQAQAPSEYTESWHEANSPSSEVLKRNLKDLLVSCKSSSAKLDLVEQLRRELVLQCADALGYKKVFLADNATNLSVSILGYVAQGRGSQLAGRVHFKSIHHDMEIYRPMREILQNEVDYYVKISSLRVVEAPGFRPKDTSIFSCTKDFVLGLQKDFPATIPTIFRTGDKLMSSTSNQSNCTTPEPCETPPDASSELCVMCGSFLDTEQKEASALHAILVSQKFSCPKPQVNGFVEDVSGEGGCCGANETASQAGDSCGCDGDGGGCGDKNKENEHLTKELMESYLCYGCRIILRELGEVKLLPKKMSGPALEQERRKLMREQIQDFLL